MLRISILPSRADLRGNVTAELFTNGVESLLEEGDALVVFTPDAAGASRLQRLVMGADNAATVETSDAGPATNWAIAWRERFSPLRVGALTIVPTWLADGADPAATVVIEPAMAFGTGDHATTRGVLALMQGTVRPGDLVADLGAGSAILAIAAAKLGAARVAAVELDPEAIPNAELNVERNGVADRVTVIEGDAAVVLPLLAPVNVVLANIISSAIRELLPAVRRSLAPGGHAIFSGMLTVERDTMLSEFARAGLAPTAEERDEEWWSVHCVRSE